MRALKFYMLFVFVAGSLLSCRTPITTQSALTAYTNNPDNGLKKVQEIDKIKVEATYLPWQFMAAKLHMRDTGLVSQIKHKCYFILGLSANNKELLRQLPYDKYSEMVQVLAFRLKSYVKIITDKGKSVDAEECLFEQTYGMGAENELLLVFDKDKLDNAGSIDLKISEFGLNIGDQDFKFMQKDITNIPPIKII